MDTKKTTNKFSAEVRERAVRMVRDHQGDHASQWAAIASIASKIGCTAESLRRWLRQAERDAGMRIALAGFRDGALVKIPVLTAALKKSSNQTDNDQFRTGPLR